MLWFKRERCQRKVPVKGDAGFDKNHAGGHRIKAFRPPVGMKTGMKAAGRPRCYPSESVHNLITYAPDTHVSEGIQ
jgi:hypothetical protein